MARHTRRAASASASISASTLTLTSTSTASTAAPEYRESVRHYREASVLKPVSPSTHTDDWPCFLLSHATVHRHDGSLANQLEADLEGPFLIRGRLELEKDNERYLIHRQMKTEPLWIQIESSHAFSVGAKDDSLSVPVVWASGGAGWFEIVPAESYRRICDTMFQGVCLHYSFLDQYEAALEKLQKSRKKKRATLADVSLGLDELLFQYALRAGNGLTLPEAYQRLDEQCIFLLSHFPKDTGVFHYLANKFPDPAQKLANKDAKDIRARTRASAGPCPLKAYDYDHARREKSSSLEGADGKNRGKERGKAGGPRTTRASEASDVELAGGLSNKNHNTRQPSRPTRTKRRSPIETRLENDVVDVVMRDSATSDNLTPPPRTPHDHRHRDRDRGEMRGQRSTADDHAPTGSTSSARVLVDALEDVRGQMLQLISQGRQKKQLDQITAKSWQTKVYMECNIKHYKSTGEIFRYYAREIAQHLGPEWYDTQIYRWIGENASTPPTLTLISEAEVRHIVRRVKKAGRGAGAARAERTASENPQTEAREYAGKQTPKSRLSGKAAGLRPSTGGKKRLRYDVDLGDKMDLKMDLDDDDDDDEDDTRKKKPKRSHDLTEGDDDDNDNDGDDGGGDDDEDDGNNDDDDASGGRTSHRAKTKGDDIQFVIRAEKLPSTRPQGPNKTWVCETPDCGYIVRAADEEEGRKLIGAHYEEHEKEAQDVAQETALDRENLAVQEGTRGHMPINHLLEKIRTLGENSKQRNEIHIYGRAVPEPIKRTLFI